MFRTGRLVVPAGAVADPRFRGGVLAACGVLAGVLAGAGDSGGGVPQGRADLVDLESDDGAPGIRRAYARWPPGRPSLRASAEQLVAITMVTVAVGVDRTTR